MRDSEYLAGLNIDNIVMPETHEDVPVFRTRRQWKRHMVNVHNAQYLDRKGESLEEKLASVHTLINQL